MPITPLHFGPAFLAKAVAPKHFSILAFGFTQAVMDLEPVYYMVQGLWPIHRYIHTYLGATLIAIFTVALGKPLLERGIQVWNGRFALGRWKRLRTAPRISWLAAISGALFGGYSHVLLDSIVHFDVRPFAPWSDSNGLLNLMSISQLYLLCAGLGIFGGVALLLVCKRR